MDEIKKKKKARAHEEKGDRYLTRGKLRKALDEYKKSTELDPENVPLCDKLIATHQKTKEEWTDSDFAESLSWTMKQQELKNPALKRVHAKLEPVWKEISTLVQGMMQAKDEAAETGFVEKIAAFDQKAVYPLIEALLSFKKIFRKNTTKEQL